VDLRRPAGRRDGDCSCSDVLGDCGAGDEHNYAKAHCATNRDMRSGNYTC
jgi:hypothetical protein